MKKSHSFDERVSRMVRAIEETEFQCDVLALKAALDGASARRNAARNRGSGQVAEKASGRRAPAGGCDGVEIASGLAALARSLEAASSPAGEVCDS